MLLIKVYKTQFKKLSKNGIENEPLEKIMLVRKIERKKQIDPMDLDIIKHHSKNENDTEQNRQEMYEILVKYTNKKDMQLMDDILHCDCGDLSIHSKAVLDAYINREDFFIRHFTIIPSYFANRMVDDKCTISRKDIEDIIDRAKKIQADNTLAESLLPIKEGEYDKRYFLQIDGIIGIFEDILNDWDEKTAGWIEIQEIEKKMRVRRERPIKEMTSTEEIKTEETTQE